MRKDKLSKQNVILYFLGIIPVVWLGLLIAPCLEDGLIGLVQQFGTIMQNPFSTAQTSALQWMNTSLQTASTQGNGMVK